MSTSASRRPERVLTDMVTFRDYGIVSEGCPTAPCCVIASIRSAAPPPIAPVIGFSSCRRTTSAGACSPRLARPNCESTTCCPPHAVNPRRALGAAPSAHAAASISGVDQLVRPHQVGFAEVANATWPVRTGQQLINADALVFDFPSRIYSGRTLDRADSIRAGMTAGGASQQERHDAAARHAPSGASNVVCADNQSQG